MTTRRNQPHTELQNILKEITATLSVEAICGTEIGSDHLDIDRTLVIDAFSLLRTILNANLTQTPIDHIETIKTSTLKLKNALYSGAQHHTKQDRTTNSLQENTGHIRGAYQSLYSTAAPIVGFELQREANAAARADMATAELGSIKKAREECETILKKIKEYAIDRTISGQSEYFKEVSDEHLKASKDWLIGIAVSGAVIAGMALYASICPPSHLVQGSFPLTLLAYAPRFLVLSVAFYSLSLCSRNYRTSRHNYIINKHRSVALSTFNVFTSAASDSKVKDAVLAQAASTIFSPQASGYSVEQAEPLPQATAVELLQRIGSK